MSLWDILAARGAINAPPGYPTQPWNVPGATPPIVAPSGGPTPPSIPIGRGGVFSRIGHALKGITEGGPLPPGIDEGSPEAQAYRNQARMALAAALMQGTKQRGTLGNIGAALGAQQQASGGYLQQLLARKNMESKALQEKVRNDLEARRVAAYEESVNKAGKADASVVEIIGPDGKPRFKKRSDLTDQDIPYHPPTSGAMAASAVTPDALEAAAERYRQTGTLPTGISRSPQVVAKILDRAAQRAQLEGDDVKAASIQQQANKAKQSALMQLEKTSTLVGSFEKTANKNADLALGLSQKVDRTQTPVLNRWINAGRANVLGDVDVAKFVAAHETFVLEYAKIISGSMGNTPISDAAREHARQVLNAAMTPEQYAAAVGVLKQDMNNRIKGFDEQRQQLYSDLPDISGNSQAPTSAGESAAERAKRLGIQ